MNILKRADTPKVNSIVTFRPWGRTLDDVDYWSRWTTRGRWFSLQEEPQRHLVGVVVAIKRVGGEFYYRITSGSSAWDAAPQDVKILSEDYYTG